MHVADIMPTLLELAGAEYPARRGEQELPPLMGKSWTPVLSGKAESVRSDEDYLAWEIFGNYAVRQGDWKIRWQYKPFGREQWELFNLADDPAERNDLAAQHADKVTALAALWDEYARENNVILPSRSVYEGLEEQLPERFAVEAGFPPLLYQQQFVPPKDKLATEDE
jgi:arylsulfatase